MFGAYVLLTRPELFSRYILSSPSLWWDNQLLFRLEEERATSHDDLAARVYTAIGSLETDEGRRLEAAGLPVGHPLKPPDLYLDMVDDFERFVAQLCDRDYPGLDLTSAVFPDEFHATVPSVALSRGLRRFFAVDAQTSTEHRD